MAGQFQDQGRHSTIQLCQHSSVVSFPDHFSRAAKNGLGTRLAQVFVRRTTGTVERHAVITQLSETVTSQPCTTSMQPCLAGALTEDGVLALSSPVNYSLLTDRTHSYASLWVFSFSRRHCTYSNQRLASSIFVQSNLPYHLNRTSTFNFAHSSAMSILSTPVNSEAGNQRSCRIVQQAMLLGGGGREEVLE